MNQPAVLVHRELVEVVGLVCRNCGFWGGFNLLHVIIKAVKKVVWSVAELDGTNEFIHVILEGRQLWDIGERCVRWETISLFQWFRLQMFRVV